MAELNHSSPLLTMVQHHMHIPLPNEIHVHREFFVPFSAEDVLKRN